MSYLLDTCILSKLRKIKKNPDKKLESWVNKHNESSYFISALTIGEIQLGISKLNLKNASEKQKHLILEDWLHNELIPRFATQILEIDIKTILIWGKISGECQRRGINIPVVDGLIAATAIANNLTVVTENIDDFVETGVRLFNPWIE